MLGLGEAGTSAQATDQECESMAVRSMLRPDVRYVLTDEGRSALKNAQQCQCSQLWVTDGVYQCCECSTIYSVVYGFTMTPRKLRGRMRA